MNKFKSIQVKVFLLISIFFTIMILSIMSYNIHEIKAQESLYLKELNQNNSSLLVKKIKMDLYNLNYTNIKSAMSIFRYKYLKNIIVITKNGYIFAQKNNDSISLKKYKNFSKLLKNKSDNFTYLSPIKIANETIGYLLIKNNEKIFLDNLDKKIIKIIKLFIFVIIISILFSFFIAIKITNPINIIIKKLKKLKDTEKLQFNSNHKDEFKYLEEIIELKHNKIIEFNKNLQIQIDLEVQKNIQKEKILYEQSKMASLGEMISNIAHQWRQPLSAISMSSTGLIVQAENNILDNKNLEQTCININKNAQYLSETIENFRNYIKGSKETEYNTLSLSINNFLDLTKGLIKSLNIEIILDLDETIKLNYNNNELIQCYMNIFNNAKDILSEKNIEKKLIFIKTYKKSQNIIIEIKDNAGGVPLDIINKIFEPYFTTKHQSLGTGIGLHMTYELICNSMNGNIQVINTKYIYDNEEYEGALFQITLPLE